MGAQDALTESKLLMHRSEAVRDGESSFFICIYLKEHQGKLCTSILCSIWIIRGSSSARTPKLRSAPKCKRCCAKHSQSNQERLWHSHGDKAGFQEAIESTRSEKTFKTINAADNSKAVHTPLSNMYPNLSSSTDEHGSSHPATNKFQPLLLLLLPFFCSLLPAWPWRTREGGAAFKAQRHIPLCSEHQEHSQGGSPPLLPT